MDADLIDPTRDRVWAVDVTVTYTTYVVADAGDAAEKIADDASDEDLQFGSCSARYLARELTAPLGGGEGEVIAWGRSLWGEEQLTVNEAVALIASRVPVQDTSTLLMPFVDAAPLERLEAR
jgi:hypothetical protein